MIGFKVIDTENGDVENDVKYEYVVDQVGWLSKINSDDREIQVDSRYKAVPSITIDGVEYYHGMVLMDSCGELFVVRYSMYREVLVVRYGWNICFDGECMRICNLGDKYVGNVWQPEHRHLLPLLEE